MTNENTHKYDAIIDLPHHVSATRPRMSMIDRAAQFSPFAALTGYDAAIKETGRLTDTRLELSEESRSILDRKQQKLLEHINSKPLVTVTHFVPDSRKDGGAYVDTTGNIKRIDPVSRTIVFTDNTQIKLDDIIDLKGNCIQEEPND